MSNTDATTVELGDLSPRLRAKIESGEYGSLREVVLDGLDALEREQATFDDYLREKVEEALSDPRPSIPAEEVFARLYRRHEELLKQGQREP